VRFLISEVPLYRFLSDPRLGSGTVATSSNEEKRAGKRAREREGARARASKRERASERESERESARERKSEREERGRVRERGGECVCVREIERETEIIHWHRAVVPSIKTAIQGLLAHKKPPPPPSTTTGA